MTRDVARLDLGVALNLGGFLCVIHSFIHSGYFYSASASPQLLRSTPNYSTDTLSKFHADVPQAIASKGLAQSLYVAARRGFEPVTLRTKPDESIYQMADRADERLFSAVELNRNHVLHSRLPVKRPKIYSLRPRAHDYSLTPKDEQNFITRLLYKNIYR